MSKENASDVQQELNAAITLLKAHLPPEELCKCCANEEQCAKECMEQAPVIVADSGNHNSSVFWSCLKGEHFKVKMKEE